MAGEGLVTMTPTGVSHSGTSATIRPDGGVDFSAVTSVSLDGVFTSSHDNYFIVITFSASIDAEALRWRLRTGGSDASGTDYTYQVLAITGSSKIGARGTGETSGSSVITSTSNQGVHIYLYGPNLALATAARSVNTQSYSTVTFYDYSNSHTLATAYDSITFFPSAGNVTGTVHIFGYEE